VTRAHVDFEEERIGVALDGAELGDVFCGFPVHDLAVVQAGLNEKRGIVRRGEIGVRAVGLHVEVIVGELRLPHSSYSPR